ncbi:protein serine/threonine phosphatase 2C [Thozetella sp. PMI_491]|nr:protein serine/threonine phosphatase 2C [Thozetella sp. PMI_491]
MASEQYHGLNWQRRNYPVLDLEAATEKLREHESSFYPQGLGATPVLRFDTSRVEAHTPCEDTSTVETVDFGNGKVWQFWGVFDGHAGSQCSTVLAQSLVSYVAEELRPVLSAVSDDADLIDQAIKRGFLKLDEDILQTALKAVQDDTLSRLEILADVAPASSGAMAVIAVYDPDNSILRIASVGDSAAVLGQAKPGGHDWAAVALSEPQTPDRPDEREKLIAAHPDEPGMIVDGRVAGLPVTRAFGGLWCKLPLDACKKAHELAYAGAVKPNNKTPPYTHAEPEITTTQIKNGDFVILATDGIWDTMSAENAVKCMALWIEETNRQAAVGKLLGELTNVCAASDPVPGCEDLTCQIGCAWKWKARPEDFVIEDANGATHLIRNAIGGNRREQFLTVLSVLYPYIDRARDDMTAQVIFFGDVMKAC